jgi:N-acetyl-gamma-glutamyl-phosphate reductase
VVVTAAIDNLTKGASGQAVQAMNIMLGLPELRGLELISVTP